MRARSNLRDAVKAVLFRERRGLQDRPELALYPEADRRVQPFEPGESRFPSY